MFNTDFSEHNKILEAHKKFRGNCPKMPPRVCGSGQNRRQKVFHWGPSCLYKGLDILKIYI